MKIYVITCHNSMSKKDVAYATSKRKIEEYFSLTTGGEAVEEISPTEKNVYNENTTLTDIFKKHRENVLYKGNDFMEWYSYRVENSI